MNKRIIELAKQAGFQLGIVFEDYATSVETITTEQRKFAELIIKECAKIAGDFEYSRLHDSLVEDHILKHFGVNE